jgi:elongation factor P
MFIQATQMRVGTIILYQNDLHRVMELIHITPGNKRGFVQTKMRNLRTGLQTENKFRSEEKIERAVLDAQEMEYLY